MLDFYATNVYRTHFHTRLEYLNNDPKIQFQEICHTCGSFMHSFFFNGIRVTGNTAWIEKKDWKDFSDYEEEINKVVGNYRMIVLCTYSAEICGINEILGVMKTHQVATIRKEGKWEILQKYGDSLI